MSDLNFLPLSYRRARLRQRVRRIEIGTVILLAALFAAGWGQLWTLRTQLAERVAGAEVLADQAFRLRDELLGLESERLELHEQSRLYRTLEPRLRFSDALRILAGTLPPESGLADLDVRHRDDASPRLDLGLRVICADDRQVASAVASLAQHPIFTGIEVQAVVPVEEATGPMREVSLEATIDLNRRFTLVTEGAAP
ncbi:hypothetical protein [Mucisphaera calidilacus]|uniref:Uncharacterized protein n=1 Tax=Mucisphaera calidilacus TaxID=2527982 RepID=A0A518BTB3_9BACT|nr:hypothetical protein [Mucisphaera calidilacus]QDU70199.1 hypothetical protein Pan265_00210 [Mucisphaera calidilacus]